MKNLLSAGSIVKIKGIPKRLFMIMGYLPKSDKKVYDYSAVLYPIGLLNPDGAFVLDQDGIEEVVFQGYLDEEGKAYTEALPVLAEGLYQMKQKEQAGE